MIEKITQNNEFEKQKAWLNTEVGKRISVSPKLEKFGFIGLMNRTNTGAFTTAVGRSPTLEPIVRHIQPVKAIARGLMTHMGMESSTPLEFLKDTIEIGEGIHIVKETIGPNMENPAEWMDALDLFLEKGVPPEKTFFFPTFRNPFDVAASWKKMWKWEWEDFPFDSINKSMRITLDTMSKAEKNGITVVPYIHDLLKDYGSSTVVSRMFNIVDLPFSDKVVNWNSDDNDPYFAGKIIKYDMPPDEWVRGALGKAKGGRGGLTWRAIEDEHQLPTEIKELLTEKTPEVFEAFTNVYARTKELLRL